MKAAQINKSGIYIITTHVMYSHPGLWVAKSPNVASVCFSQITKNLRWKSLKINCRGLGRGDASAVS